MKKQRIVLGVLFFCLAAGSSVRAEDYLTEKQSRPLLGTIVSVEVCYVDGRQDDVKAAVDRVWQRLEEINARMDLYNPKSDVSRINAAGGATIKVHEDVARLIRLSLDIGARTRGAFDITIRPLVDLWKRGGAENRYPSLADIMDAKTHLGADKIDMAKDGAVRLTDPAAKIDLNGDAPGFAADEAARILRDARLHNFMVDAGGEIYAAGSNCHGKAWRFGVRDPDRQGKVVDIVELGDAAISTSGDYEKYVTIQGQRRSHIINPQTGYPQAGVASATVIAPTAVEADVLSTAMCVLGPAEGLDLIRELGDGYEALLLFRRDGEKYEWHSTPGYESRRVGLPE